MYMILILILNQILIIDLSAPCDMHTRATWPHVTLYNIYIIRNYVYIHSLACIIWSKDTHIYNNQYSVNGTYFW